MPQSFSPCREWDYESEPLLFDEEFCQNLMKDLEMIPTPPQSPPTKPGFAESLSSLFPSNLDQLEFVSEMLFEDQDFIHQDFYWGSDFNSSSSSSLSQGSSGTSKNQQPVVSADCLWSSDAGKSAHEKLSAVLSSSPLLSDIDTNIFQDIAATTLDCHSATLDCQQLGTELQDNLEQSSSEYDSSLSTGSVSSSDSEEEEIDVVTVEKWKSSKRRVCAAQSRRSETRFQTRAAMKRCHLEIQLQHNYAAPCPSLKKAEQTHHKRSKRDHSPKHCFSSKSRSSSSAKPSSDMEEEERRRTHNVMERQRRNELKNCFVRLRDNVPELSNNDKASKVVILKKASECIRGLEDEKQKLTSKKDRLRSQQDHLKRRLEQLRRGK